MSTRQTQEWFDNRISKNIYVTTKEGWTNGTILFDVEEAKRAYELQEEGWEFSDESTKGTKVDNGITIPEPKTEPPTAPFQNVMIYLNYRRTQSSPTTFKALLQQLHEYMGKELRKMEDADDNRKEVLGGD